MTDTTLDTERSWSDFLDRLRRYVSRRVDGAWADDVMGDILLRLAEHRDDLERARNPLAWMYRVAANVITDHHRRRAAESRALKQAAVEAETDISTDVRDAAEEETPEQALARCLTPFVRDLPANYAEALTLTELQGHTQADAAAASGLSHSGMKSRVQRGRILLKQRLLKCCDIALDRRGRVMDVRRRNQPSQAGCARSPDC